MSVKKHHVNQLESRDFLNYVCKHVYMKVEINVQKYYSKHSKIYYLRKGFDLCS